MGEEKDDVLTVKSKYCFRMLCEFNNVSTVNFR